MAYRLRVRAGWLRIGLLLLLLSAAWPLASAPAAAAAGSAEPCELTPTPGDSVITITSGGVARTALLHIPPGTAGRPLPLLVGLHGAGGKFFEPYSGFSVLADAEDFIALYPDPIEEADGHTSWNIDESRYGPDDVQFISELLSYVEAKLCVDTSRVYAAGVSNGGGMAALLACQLSWRFAAFASIAGGYSSLPPCEPTNPVSVVEVHGTADGSVRYDGTPGTGAGAVRPWLAAWRTRDACQGSALLSRIAPRVERYDWSDCEEGTAVEHLEVFGGEHQLPGGLPPDFGQASTISAAWEVWRFLSVHEQAPAYPAEEATAPPTGTAAATRRLTGAARPIHPS